MASIALAENLYIHPTPAGTYYAVSATEANPSRKLIQSLLKTDSSPSEPGWIEEVGRYSRRGTAFDVATPC